jgi:hypothetical protein
MKYLAIVIILFSFFSGNLYSQEMMPPKPLENKVLEAMTGEWTGVGESMGMKWNESLKIEWMLNHQFIKMQMTMYAEGKPEMKYSGTGIYGVGTKGECLGWWFDDWGANAVSTGTGEFDFDKMSLHMVSKNSMYIDDRTIYFENEKMFMKAVSTMKMPDGKETKAEEKTEYTKKLN